MAQQTTAPPFYRNQTSHPVSDRLAITNNRYNETPRTRNVQPRTNNFTKFGNQPLSERTQTKCSKCNQLGHLPNQYQNFQIPPQRKAPLGIDHIQERLPTILLQLPGRQGLRLLVGTGAGINLLKRRCYPGRTIIPDTKKFSMGHSK